MSNYKVVSLFSGCGGLDLGITGGFSYLGKYYDRNPFDIVWANDINERATQTQKLNFPDLNVVCGDITNILGLNDDEQVSFLPSVQFPKADVVIGGFPCQDFSLAGKRQGLTVQRGKLYQSMAKVIEIIKPKVFLAENVKGLISWKDGLAIETIINDFSNLGYRVEYKLFNTADFGVPQNRERVIIVGIRNDIDVNIDWIKPTHSSTDTSLLPWLTIKDAIGDLEDDEMHQSLPNYGYSKAKYFPGKQGNTITKADKPAPTMRAEHHGNIEFHYSLPRRLSAREAARIQSFPDDFVFVKSISDAYRQIGNAVAPVFAWHIAKMLIKILDQAKDVNKMGSVYNKLFDDQNTNARGVEITPEALELLENCDDTRFIDINFVRTKTDYREIYTKWLDAWRDEY